MRECVYARVDVLCVLEFIMFGVIKKRKEETARLVGSALYIYVCACVKH